MMPVIEAQERHTFITDTCVGTGNMKAADRGSLMRKLLARANNRSVKTEMSMDAKMAALATMGIMVTDLRKKK